jgi:hypothetical protein
MQVWVSAHAQECVPTFLQNQSGLCGSHMMFMNCCSYDEAKGTPRFEDLCRVFHHDNVMVKFQGMETR